MQKFITVAKKNEKSKKLEKKILDELLQYGWTENREEPDTVIFIGGDGTLLYAVQKYLDQLDHVNFVGINTMSLSMISKRKSLKSFVQGCYKSIPIKQNIMR